MIYLKSYCYNKHELAFVIANLIEGYNFIDKLLLYEYNFTHTGIPKNYELEPLIKDKLPVSACNSFHGFDAVPSFP